MTDNNRVRLAHELTIAWLSNPHTRASASEVGDFMQTVANAVEALTPPPSSQSSDTPAVQHTPAVSVRKSLSDPNRIVSLIDGTIHASLTRHLKTHGLTPDEYRARYNLKADYPMIAPGYSEARRATAKRLGLGRKPGQKVATKSKEGTSGKRGAKSISEAKKAAQAHLGTSEG